MTIEEAVEFIRPANISPGGKWVDLGAGTGTFTRALATLLGADGTVLAVDRDKRAVKSLLADAAAPAAARIHATVGDMRALDAVPELRDTTFDGVILANVLHFVARPDYVLTAIQKYLEPNARIIVVEYDRREANRWVPHPLPAQLLAYAMRAAGLPAPITVNRRRSRFQGELYCTVTSFRGRG